MKEKKKNKLILYLTIFFASYIVSYLLFSLLSSMFSFFNDFTKKKEGIQPVFDITKGLFNKWSFIVPIFIGLVVVGYIFIKEWLKTKPSLALKTSSKFDEYGKARFLTDEEKDMFYGKKIGKNKYASKCWETIQDEFVNGMVLSTKIVGGTSKYKTFNPVQMKEEEHYKGGKLMFRTANNVHTLCMGTTGVGKTKYIIIPSIEFMLNSKNKPSILSLDVKGEIRERTLDSAKKNGYEVYSIDLRNPVKSNKFNPMSIVMYYYKKYLKSKWTNKEGEQDLEALDKAIGLLKSVVDMFKQQGNDAFWSNVPSQMLETYLWSLIDNYEYCSFSGGGTPFMFRDESEVDETLISCCKRLKNFGKEEGITLENVSTMLSFSAEELHKYFSCRYTGSNSYLLGNTNIVAQIKFDQESDSYSFTPTFQSMMATFSNSFNNIMGKTMFNICSTNDVSLEKIYESDKPFIIYFLMPDEDKSKYPFASLLINFIYSFFVNLAQVKLNSKIELENKLKNNLIDKEEFDKESKKLELRNVHFIMDEFANLSKLENITSWLSVGRERKLFCHLFIQNISQLQAQDKYGVDDTQSIEANCNMKIFMKLSESNAIKWAIEMLGNKTIEKTSTSGGNGNVSTSTSLEGISLATADTFSSQLNYGEIIAMETGRSPLREKLLGTFEPELKERFNYF